MTRSTTDKKLSDILEAKGGRAQNGTYLIETDAAYWERMEAKEPVSAPMVKFEIPANFEAIRPTLIGDVFVTRLSFDHGSNCACEKCHTQKSAPPHPLDIVTARQVWTECPDCEGCGAMGPDFHTPCAHCGERGEVMEVEQ